MTMLMLETLELRRLLSVSLAESEPNNSRATADVIPRIVAAEVGVSADISGPGDHDWFKIQLKQGDVLGAAVIGRGALDPNVRLVNSAGELMIACDDSFLSSDLLPPESPLPRGEEANDAEIYHVVSVAGTYYLDVSGSDDNSTGNYAMDVVVARPGMEAHPQGARQILFLDFDGAKVDFSQYSPDAVQGFGKMRVAPLADSLGDWGLRRSDEDAIIDQIVARVTDKLSTFVAANGANDNFGIEIRNSRDHADRFGKNPLVSRVVVGAINDAEFSAVALGVSQYDDVGNFTTNDDAVAAIDFLTDAVAFVPVEAPESVFTLIGEAAADLIAHEAGHNFGANHTDQTFDANGNPAPGTPNIMDPDFRVSLGPDFVWGSDDDVDLQFGVDEYWREEPFRGRNDTLNTVAFGLSTGKGTASRSVRSMPVASIVSTTMLPAARELLETPDAVLA